MRSSDMVVFGGFVVLAVAVGCGDDSTGGGGGSTTTTSSSSGTTTSSSSSSTSSSGGTGHCAQAVAATACSTDCAFDPTTVDCATACANVATVCAGGACDTQCAGMQTDPTTCQAACEATKSMHCTNLAFGCYATSTDCTAVGTCVQDNMSTNL